MSLLFSPSTSVVDTMYNLYILIEDWVIVMSNTLLKYSVDTLIQVS